HTRFSRDWSSDVCSSDLPASPGPGGQQEEDGRRGEAQGEEGVGWHLGDQGLDDREGPAPDRGHPQEQELRLPRGGASPPDHHPYPPTPSRSCKSPRTCWGLAFPWLRRITWPMRKPMALVCPARMSSTGLGFSAITRSTRASSSLRSLICARPRSA